MKHRDKSQVLRALVTQEARVVYEAPAGPDGSYCQVQVLTPSEPGVVAWLDIDPKEIGPNRVYKGAPMTASRYIPIDLLPGQFLVLATDDGSAACTLIVHHLMDD